MTNRSPRRWVVLAATCLFLLPAREVHGQAPPAEPSTASGAQVDTPGSAPSSEAGISGDAWVGLAGALVGAALGFGAAIAAVKLNNREAKRRHAEAVRIARLTILSEVEVNRENFAADWRRVSEEYEPSDVPPVNRAGMYPAPPVIATAWEGQIDLVPEAFSAEETAALHRFYASARTAVAVREGIRQLYVSDAPQQSRNEAFELYGLHAARVRDFSPPSAAGGG
ncbi:MAG TPA: hypothetical protein VF167_12975 [Longimicrobiaceae bacterium]